MSAFIVTTETMQRVVHAVDNHGSAAANTWGGFPVNNCAGLDALGAALFDLNEEAVAQRYVNHPREQAPRFHYRPLGDVPLTAQFRAIECLLYQCSEGNCGKLPLYQLLVQLRNKLARQIASKASEHEPWDFPERAPTAMINLNPERTDAR